MISPSMEQGGRGGDHIPVVAGETAGRKLPPTRGAVKK